MRIRYSLSSPCVNRFVDKSNLRRFGEMRSGAHGLGERVGDVTGFWTTMLRLLRRSSLAFTPLIHDQTVTEKLKVPNALQIGDAYAVQPNITLMAQYSWENWAVYHSDTFVGGDGFMVTVPRNYNSAHIYRGGLEWQLSGLPALTMRFGGVRSISSQPKDTVSPSLTDGNSWAGSIGAGYNIVPSFRIDFGYQHALFDRVTATGMDAFPGSYSTHVDIFTLGIAWRSDVGMTAGASAPATSSSTTVNGY